MVNICELFVIGIIMYLIVVSLQEIESLCSYKSEYGSGQLYPRECQKFLQGEAFRCLTR